MSIFNSEFLPIMRKHIEQIRTQIQAEGKPDFSTVDVIRKYIGNFHSDGTNPHDSINANIGKFLADNANALGIEEKAANQPYTYKDGGKEKHTTTSIWEFK